MPPRRRRPRRKAPSRSFGLWVVLLALGALLFAGGYLLGHRPRSHGAGTEAETVAAGSSASGARRTAGPKDQPAGQERREPPPVPSERYPPDEVIERVEPPPGPMPPGAGVRLALVIDDLGRSLQDVEDLEALGVSVTYAVLPFESKTAEVVARIRQHGHELICHLPMEPRNGANPGPGALQESMTRAQLSRATEKALAAVPGATGVNNHMGSSLTADPKSMRTVLGVVAEHGLFFLDSRTSAESVGYRQAVALGLPAAERQVFLDSDPTVQGVREQFHRWLSVARQRGAAIAIGHPHPTTLEVLAEEIPRAREAGYEFVPLSYLLDYAGDPQP